MEWFASTGPGWAVVGQLALDACLFAGLYRAMAWWYLRR